MSSADDYIAAILRAGASLDIRSNTGIASITMTTAIGQVRRYCLPVYEIDEGVRGVGTGEPFLDGLAMLTEVAKHHAKT